MKEKKPADELAEKIEDCYLEHDKIDGLINDFSAKADALHKTFQDEKIPLPDEFLWEIALWWTADDFRATEIYSYYVSRMLIKPDLAFWLRDYFIYYIYKSD
jgi:hypothetical protein